MIRLTNPAVSIRMMDEILTEKILIKSIAVQAQSMIVIGIGFLCIF